MAAGNPLCVDIQSACSLISVRVPLNFQIIRRPTSETSIGHDHVSDVSAGGNVCPEPNAYAKARTRAKEARLFRGHLDHGRRYETGSDGPSWQDARHRAHRMDGWGLLRNLTFGFQECDGQRQWARSYGLQRRR